MAVAKRLKTEHDVEPDECPGASSVAGWWQKDCELAAASLLLAPPSAAESAAATDAAADAVAEAPAIETRDAAGMVGGQAGSAVQAKRLEGVNVQRAAGKGGVPELLPLLAEARGALAGEAEEVARGVGAAEEEKRAESEREKSGMWLELGNAGQPFGTSGNPGTPGTSGARPSAAVVATATAPARAAPAPAATPPVAKPPLILRPAGPAGPAVPAVPAMPAVSAVPALRLPMLCLPKVVAHSPPPHEPPASSNTIAAASAAAAASATTAAAPAFAAAAAPAPAPAPAPAAAAAAAAAAAVPRIVCPVPSTPVAAAIPTVACSESQAVPNTPPSAAAAAAAAAANAFGADVSGD
ncbi:unnamed protein product [Closterium sp. NIES-65]|nr:unnamed protein product [Closterium sp. NIES-65]